MNESKAARYQRLRRRTDVVAWVLAGATLALIGLTPVARWLHLWAASVSSLLPAALAPVVTLTLYVAAVVGLCELAIVPAEFHRSRWIDPAYGRPASGTLRARVAGTVVLMPAVLVAAAIVLLAGWLAPAVWWLPAGALLAAGLAAAVRIGPSIVGQLGGVRPFGRPSLEARIAGLADRVGVPVSAIQEWRVPETSPTVAMVAGIGRGRRVLVASEVLRHWSDDEVTVVVAHELAHHVHRDLTRSLAVDTTVMTVGLFVSGLVVPVLPGWIGATGPGDPVALPAVAFVTLVVWLAATPVRHAQSRRQERRADRFALQMTGQASAFASAVRRASSRSLVDDQPSRLTRWLFHRHPSVAERLALAERYLQAQADRR